MSVEIDPQELGFPRPFTVEVLENLRIRNPNTHPVAFKVKTTAPKQYCVRPNSGRVEPGKEVEVQVILQAMKAEPAPGTKCRDKFLVQSVAITGDKEFDNLASIWDNIDKSSIQERKIRVIFQDPKAGADHTLATPVKKQAPNGVEDTPEAPPAYTPPSAYSAPLKKESPSGAPASSSFAAPVAVATTRNSESSNEELKEQLLQAEKIIAQLKAEQSGLRQRKAGASEEKPASKPAALAQQAARGTEGVPIQYAAILCLLSFLLAYIFF